uniref:NPH3 domain-containing protein n=1 Tax=Oryza punctata TaxID=4537 RepID=A0A0E0KEE3_ORYPU
MWADPAPGVCGGGGGGGVVEDDITCDFLLKLLRVRSMVGPDAALLQELESMTTRRVDQAMLGAVMIPCGTLLDVLLVMRLVRGFLKDAGGRLVDVYLVESALEAVLQPAEFEESSLAPCLLVIDVLDLPSVPATAPLPRFAGQGIYLRFFKEEGLHN